MRMEIYYELKMMFFLFWPEEKGGKEHCLLRMTKNVEIIILVTANIDQASLVFLALGNSKSVLLC